LCECGVKANYSLVPSELGMGHYCGYMIDYDEVGYCCGKHEIILFSFAKSYYLFFLFEQSTRNASGKLIMVKLSSWMT
jgi:hypothetical protein